MLIPINVETVLSVLNLPQDLADNQIFTEHQSNVMDWLSKVVKKDIYEIATTESHPDALLYATSFKFAYCFYMLSSVLEFINLKTLGSGIIKSTGIDDQSTDLLSGSEIQSFKNNLEIRALTNLSRHLSLYGLELLNELKFGKKEANLRNKKTRAKVI